MTRRPASLRLRLLLGTLAGLAAAILVAGWIVERLFEQHLARQFDAEQQTHLNQLAALLEFDADGRPVLKAALSDPRFARPYSGLYWQVAGLDGAPLLRSRSLWDAALDIAADRLAAGERHEHRAAGPQGETLRLIEQPLYPSEDAAAPVRLLVAADEAGLNAALARFNASLRLALALLAGALALAAVAQAMIGLRPLRQLRDELRRLREGRQQALENAYPGEIQPVVDELNRVLARNADFVDRARSQAGNLAHAVKTPLAVIANAAADEPGPFAELAAAQVDLARRQIDHHLARARQAAAAQLPGQRCRLAPAAAGLIRLMQKVHADKALTLLAADLPETLVFRGEAQDLQEMLGNLLDNACQWARGEVRIAAAGDGERLVIDIDDDGPGIPPEQRERLLRRGMRGDEQIPGSGLGLAIVDDLARGYGGSLTLETAPDGGLRARLVLPGGEE